MSPAGTAGGPEIAPEGFRLLDSDDRTDFARGNLVFHWRDAEAGDAVLKIYQRRNSRWHDAFGNFSQRFVEGKRGVDAERRRETEAAALAAWQRHGCEAPRLLDRPLPAFVGARPALVMEHVPGPDLRARLSSADVTPPRKEALVARLAADTGQRHRRALDEDEPLLVQEHPALQHVLVHGDRLVPFDFEHAYREGFPIARAVAFELASLLRSFGRRHSSAERDRFEAVFVEAYGEREILRESCRRFASGALPWRIYRWHETLRRGDDSKTATMARLAERLGEAT